MDSQILITYAGQYSLNNEKGETVNGTSVTYFFVEDDLVDFKTMDYSSDPGIARGMNRAKVSLELSEFTNITKVPALYKGSFDMGIGADGKPMLKLKSVKFLSGVELKRLEEVPEKAQPTK